MISRLYFCHPEPKHWKQIYQSSRIIWFWVVELMVFIFLLYFVNILKICHKTYLAK